MRLTPPTKNVYWIATVLAVLGLLGSFVSIPFVSAYEFWFVARWPLSCSGWAYAMKGF